MRKVKDLKDGKSVNSGRYQKGTDGYRITTNQRNDPNFKANMSRFLGDEPTEKDHMYKNYRAFYGGATPSISKATQMGAAAQNQQKTLLRNKLAENAQRILNTKSFVDERTEKILNERREMAKMS